MRTEKEKKRAPSLGTCVKHFDSHHLSQTKI